MNDTGLVTKAVGVRVPQYFFGTCEPGSEFVQAIVISDLESEGVEIGSGE